MIKTSQFFSMIHLLWSWVEQNDFNLRLFTLSHFEWVYFVCTSWSGSLWNMRLIAWKYLQKVNLRLEIWLCLSLNLYKQGSHRLEKIKFQDFSRLIHIFQVIILSQYTIKYDYNERKITCFNRVNKVTQSAVCLLWGLPPWNPSVEKWIIQPLVLKWTPTRHYSRSLGI